MPRYAFHAADAQGAVNRGAIEAAHEQDMYAALRRRGLSLIDCRESAATATVFSKALPLGEQVLFCRHLLALVRAGVPVHLALKDVVDMGRNRSMRAALNEIQSSVLHGSSLSAAFEAQGGRFDALFALLLRAGESTGRLPEALSYLHESLSWKMDYAARLRRMLVYPAVQISLAALATLVLMFVAVPQIMQLLGVLGQDLPWYSALLLFAVKALGFVLSAALLAAIGLALSLPMLRKMSDKLAAQADGFVLRLPFIGPLFSKMALARLAQLFAAMLESGLAMNEALQVLPRLTENRALARELGKVQAHVSGGQGFAQAFERGIHLPPYMVRLLKMGEDGGALGPSLKHIASLYQQESTAALEAILKGTGVFVTLLVGFVLAAIVLGVIYPLYQGLGTVMGQ